MPINTDDQSWISDIAWVAVYSIAVLLILFAWMYVPA
jgi:hypothetical protein